MPRPPGLEIDAQNVLSGALVDASVQAHARGTVERSFQASELPRLTDAGIIEPAEVRIAIRFSVVDGKVALDGTLGGFVTMICQRCMQPVKIEMTDEVQLLIVDDDVERVEDATGYEPIVADPARLDMRWLAEEQTLLSVPLVPKHADENCAGGEPPSEDESEPASSQRPFANLKSLLRRG
jgi:uncharacterized protein